VSLGLHRREHRRPVGLVVGGRHHPPPVGEPQGQVLLAHHRRGGDAPLLDRLPHPGHLASRAPHDLDDLAVASTLKHQLEDPAIVGHTRHLSESRSSAHAPPSDDSEDRPAVPTTPRSGTNYVDYRYRPALRAIRMGLGQVLDYASALRHTRQVIRPILYVQQRPASDEQCSNPVDECRAGYPPDESESRNRVRPARQRGSGGYAHAHGSCRP